MQRALPALRNLLQETIIGLSFAADTASAKQLKKVRVLDIADMRELDQIDWSHLLERSGAPNNFFSHQAVQDFNRMLVLTRNRQAMPINEICLSLEGMLTEIDSLIKERPNELSLDLAKRLLSLVIKLATAVAVGLLAATASVACAGTDIASALLPAAVAVVVTGLWDDLGKALITAVRSSTPKEQLKAEHRELTEMLQQVSVSVENLSQIGPRRNRDFTRARDTAILATIISFRAQELAQTLRWDYAGIYARDLCQLREMLTEIRKIAVDEAAERHMPAKQLRKLSKRLRSATQDLSSVVIPDDPNAYITAVSQPSSPIGIGPETPAYTMSSTANADSGPVTYNEGVEQRGSGPNSEPPRMWVGSGTASPRSSPGSVPAQTESPEPLGMEVSTTTGTVGPDPTNMLNYAGNAEVSPVGAELFRAAASATGQDNTSNAELSSEGDSTSLKPIDRSIEGIRPLSALE